MSATLAEIQQKIKECPNVTDIVASAGPTTTPEGEIGYTVRVSFRSDGQPKMIAMFYPEEELPAVELIVRSLNTPNGMLE